MRIHTAAGSPSGSAMSILVAAKLQSRNPAIPIKIRNHFTSKSPTPADTPTGRHTSTRRFYSAILHDPATEGITALA